LLECVLGVGADFTRHSFGFDLFSEAPRSAVWLVDHGALVIPFRGTLVGYRGVRAGERVDPAEIQKATNRARREVKKG
jgi:hypothetical protein